MWLDNNLIYTGDLRMHQNERYDGQSILFTSNPILVKREKGNVGLGFSHQVGVSCVCRENPSDRQQLCSIYARR